MHNVAICGRGYFNNIVSNYAWVQVSDLVEADKIHEMYRDSLRFRGWKICKLYDSDDVVGDHIVKFIKDGHIRYVVRWED
jgi:hypothetical protein